MEEKKSKSISLGTAICIFIIIILVAALVGMWLYFNNENKIGDKEISQVTVKNEENTNVKEEQNTNKEEELNINSEEVKNLYAKILKVQSEYSPIKEYSSKTYSFYKSNKTTIENLNNDEKSFAVVSYLMQNNYGTKVLMNSVSENIRSKLSYHIEGENYEPASDLEAFCTIYKNEDIEYVKDIIYGSNINIENISFRGLACAIEFISGDYYFYYYPGGGRGAEDRLFTKIEKATKQGEYIYIYDKCLYVALDPDTEGTANEKLALYTNTDKTKKIDTVEPDWERYHNADSSYMDSYLSKLDTYKHTFKKDLNGNYCWVSSEPIVK